MAVAHSPLKRQRLTERETFTRPLRVDRERCIVYGAKLLGGLSKNRRRYPTETLREAVNAGLYEGVKLCIDHPADPTDERPMSAVIGRAANVSLAGDGLRGDLHLDPEHRDTARILEDAESGRGLWALSQNADGDTRGEPDGTDTVVRIVEVRSLDFVSRPASTKSLSEGVNPIDRITVKQLLETLSVRPGVPAKTRKKLLEAMEDEALMADPAMDAEMDAPPDSGDHNEHLASGFKAALAALVNEDLPEKDLLKRLKDIIRAKSSLLGGDGAKDAGADAGVEEEPVVEADDAECGPDGKPFGKKDDMKESIRRLHRTNAALSLLLESGVTKPSPLLLKTLSLLESDTDRRQLLHEQRVGGQGNTPRSLPPSGHGTGAKQAVTAKSRLEAWTGQKFKDN